MSPASALLQPASAPRPAAPPSATILSQSFVTPLPAITGATLQPVAYAALPGWPQDDAAAAFATFLHSCAALAKTPAEIGPVSNPVLRGGLNRAAPPRGALGTPVPSITVARLFFEANFRPLAIRPIAQRRAFSQAITSRRWKDRWCAPTPTRCRSMAAPAISCPPVLRRRATKGSGLRYDGTRLVPYWDRAAIEDGAWRAGDWKSAG